MAKSWLYEEARKEIAGKGRKERESRGKYVAD
jgi:hypothetical protein